MVGGAYGTPGFVWDSRKDDANEAKHGIHFRQAASAFSDIWGIIEEDRRHSDTEERFTLIGLDGSGRCLRVSFCYRGGGKTIRLISARLASRVELERYFRLRGRKGR